MRRALSSRTDCSGAAAGAWAALGGSGALTGALGGSGFLVLGCSGLGWGLGWGLGSGFFSGWTGAAGAYGSSWP